MTAYENKLSGDNKTTQDAVLSAKELEEWHLLGLLDHSIDAVVVPHWFSAEECLTIAERVKKSQYYSAYPDYPTVGRLGQELFECASELDLARYQADALTLIRDMRRLVHPYLWIDFGLNLMIFGLMAVIWQNWGIRKPLLGWFESTKKPAAPNPIAT